jgi:hypothetical protein
MQRKTKRFVQLMASVSVALTGFGVNAQVAPKSPTNLCIAGSVCVAAAPVPPVVGPPSNTSAPSAPSGNRKWHPGHYVQDRRAKGVYCGTDCDAARHAGYAKFLSEKNVKGVNIWVFWKYLESDAGNDFSAGISWLRNEIAYIKATYPGKQVMLTMSVGPWGQGVDLVAQSAIYPNYFVNAGCPVQETGQNSLVYRIDDATCRGYAKRMIAAYGAAFDSEPALEAVRIDQETDYGYPANANAKDNGWMDLALAASNAFPTTNIIIPLNWAEVTTAAQQEALIAYYKSIHVAVGGPDTLPVSGGAAPYSCPETYNVPCVILGNAGPTTSGHRYCGEVASMPAVETSELGYNSVPPIGGLTAGQVLASWNNDYCASHGIWDYNEETGNANQRWSGADGELATINANPVLVHSTKPAGY